ncbi:MAG: helix-turn-helix domain-containing protein [Gammaproteobacteria bacterium]|nr:helix-turn-helix domain-containing protein [Gammaproteobacteria bacterium]
MDIKLNSTKIKDLRNQHAWTQNQLADVSGLSLRTIQRIESNGSSSIESAKSLAAVFEIKVEDIKNHKYNLFKQKAMIASTFMLLILSGLFLLPANVQPIMVDLVLLSENKELANVQLLNEENKSSEMIVTNEIKIEVKSEITHDKKIKISTWLYNISKGRHTLLATPTVITEHQQTAEIRFDQYVLFLTPNL